MSKDYEQALRALGNRIRERRKTLSWTQEDLAHEAGLDRSYVGGIERGQRNISFMILCKVAQALQTDAGSLTFDLPSSPSAVPSRGKGKRRGH